MSQTHVAELRNQTHLKTLKHNPRPNPRSNPRGQPLHQIVSGSEPLALAQSSSKPGINDSAESTCTLQAHHGGALIISLAGRFLFRHTVGGKQNLQENEGDQLPDVFCRRTPPLLPLAFRIALIGVVCCCPQIRSCHLVFGPGFLPSSGCVLRCIPNFSVRMPLIQPSKFRPGKGCSLPVKAHQSDVSSCDHLRKQPIQCRRWRRCSVLSSSPRVFLLRS